MSGAWRKGLWACLVLASLAAGAAPASAVELRIALTADPAQVGPDNYPDLNAHKVIGNVYEALTALDANGQIVPALAESWEPLARTPGFRFHLRRGVKFHSGLAFTAKDVKFSYEQLLLPGNGGGINATYLDNVLGVDKVKRGETLSLEGVKILDDFTVDIELLKPDVLFPVYPLYIFDSGTVHTVGPNWATKVSAGTGPFKFAAWKQGQEVTLEAFADYWGGKPKLDTVRFLIVPSPQTALAMFETGALDVLSVADTAVRQVLIDKGLKAQALIMPRAQVRYLVLNQALYAPFRDKRVREAICLSIDQQSMVDGLYQGAAKPLYGQIPAGIAGFNPDLNAIAYDPERAKRLFAEAGHVHGAGLPNVKLTTVESFKSEHLYFAAQLADVLNWPVDVEIIERGTMIKAMNSGRVAFFAWGWTAGYADGLNFLRELWYSTSPFNRGWKNAAFDALIDQATVTADRAARFELYHKAEKILIDDWGTCPLPVPEEVVLVRKHLDGITLTPLGLLPFGKARLTD